ncbi:MAG: DedA family protein [Verrucomicrobia bacterium]|nr:DedA family protein [Cytophagales bacterium]
MNDIIEFFRFLLNSEEIISVGGIILVTLIVYLENGFFFAFFLPGDYLLFLAGVFCSAEKIKVPIGLVVIYIVSAAFLGSFTGYFIGKFLGKNLESRKDTWYFKKEYLERSSLFFLKYGGRALIAARFMPVIRTFSPLVVGMINMPVQRFAWYNFLGALAWGSSLPLLGYFLGEVFPQLADYVEYIIFFFLAVTTFAVVRTYLSTRKKV